MAIGTLAIGLLVLAGLGAAGKASDPDPGSGGTPDRDVAAFRAAFPPALVKARGKLPAVDEEGKPGRTVLVPLVPGATREIPAELSGVRILTAVLDGGPPASSFVGSIMDGRIPTRDPRILWRDSFGLERAERIPVGALELYARRLRGAGAAGVSSLDVFLVGALSPAVRREVVALAQPTPAVWQRASGKLDAVLTRARQDGFSERDVFIARSLGVFGAVEPLTARTWYARARALGYEQDPVELYERAQRAQRSGGCDPSWEMPCQAQFGWQVFLGITAITGQMLGSILGGGGAGGGAAGGAGGGAAGGAGGGGGAGA